MRASFRSAISLLLGTCALATTASALPTGSDLVNAPPAFQHDGKRIVPVDFESQDLVITFDVEKKKAVGRSRIEFYAAEAGHPMFDLVGKPVAARLNGWELGAEWLPEVAPDSSTRFRYVAKPVAAGSRNMLEIEYEFPASEVTFSASGVKVGFFMSDVGDDRNFLETFAPSNFEFDHFALDLRLELKGASATHRLFTNGEIRSASRQAWQVRFPEHFTTSSFYVHLTEKNVAVREAVYDGIAHDFPITVYADSAKDADDGMAEAKKVLAELEQDYGAFAHERLVVYVTPSGGGMEYCGATITSLWALEHEITHSWFARGYQPASGNSGWMDEAIASWRDNGYPTAAAAPNRPPVNLAAFSPYRRTTPPAAYTDGAKLISEFDKMFKPKGGMKKFLREWFSRKKHEVATTPEFHHFLEEQDGSDLDSVFNRYVYGKGSRRLMPSLPLELEEQLVSPLVSRHPRPFTKAERIALR